MKGNSLLYRHDMAENINNMKGKNVMAIIYLSEEKDNSPLDMEPYRTFNRELTEIENCLTDTAIRIPINNRYEGFCNGFTIDRCYCHRICLEFKFSTVRNAECSQDEYLIHHTMDYVFDSSFLEFEQEMAIEVTSREKYIYIPGVKQLNLSYRLVSNHMQLIFDLVAEKSKIREVCNCLISHDIMLFSRGW